MKTPCFLLLALVLVAPGRAADPIAGSALSLRIFSAAGAPTGGLAAPDSFPPVRAPAALEKSSSSPHADSGAPLLLVRSADPTQPARDAGPAPIATGEAGADPRPDSVRFEAVDVFVDSGDKPLAAYQFELKARSGEVLLAGLEGGEDAAFKAAPYYDTTALLQNKVIVAAFSTAPDLPHGRTRVARLMVQVTGPAEPAYDATLSVAGSTDGKPIPDAKLSIATEKADTATAPDTSQPSPTPNASEGVVR